jgi:hypothetical protein
LEVVLALLAEEIVEEWLNRQGYFTIRGIKLGVHEIDILAMKLEGKNPVCRHLEVQASVRPISYISPLSKAYQDSTGRKPMSANERTQGELESSVIDWSEKKFNLPRKKELREQLFGGEWSLELVINKVRHPEELAHISEHGILVHHLGDVISELERDRFIIQSAAGADLVDLVKFETGESSE